MTDIAIRVEGLGKRYVIGSSPRYRTLRDSIVRGAHAGIDRFKRSLPGTGSAIAVDRPDHLWALRDLTFALEAGQVLGVIGRNGAGKSTLLKVLSRITPPTVGRAELRGRTSSMLEVGTGFHPELTGRDNVMLSGAILGMRRRYLSGVFDEIVAFAEVEAFVDTPVKRYSSGMRLRLAFAVAAHLTADILFIDEVLAVGDAAFQRKCLGKMEDVAQAGRTIVFVSHGMPAITRLCTRCLWLDHGTLRADGSPRDVIASYMADILQVDGEVRWNDGDGPGTDDARLEAVRVRGARSGATGVFDTGEAIRIEIAYRVSRDLTDSRIIIELATADGTIVFWSADTSDGTVSGAPRIAGRYVSGCEIPARLLNEGAYRVSVWLESKNVRYFFAVPDAIGFEMERIGGDAAGATAERWEGVIRPSLPWTIDRAE